MAPLRVRTCAARFFVLQYLPACVEGLSEEVKDKDFDEEANREGDDGGKKDNNWDTKRLHLFGTFDQTSGVG